MLAFAQGVPYENLGFERFRFKPECLRRLEAPAAAKDSETVSPAPS
jgi:hypothetical protein